MGLKKFFRSEKEMSKEEAKEFLQTNGVVVKDDADYYKRKFKFQEFGKLACTGQANQGQYTKACK